MSRPESTGGEGISLREVLGAIRRRWWLLVGLALVGGVIGSWVEQREVDLYTAQVLFKKGNQTSPLAALQESGRQTTATAAEIEILRSRAVLAPVVDTLGLRLIFPDPAAGRMQVVDDVDLSPTASPGGYSLILNDEGVVELHAAGTGELLTVAEGGRLEGPGFILWVRDDAPLDESIGFRVVHMEQAVGRLRGRVRLSDVPGTSMIRAEYSDPDPEMAAAVLDALASSYQRHATRQAREEASRRRAFLEGQRQQISDSLMAAQRLLLEYQELSGNVDPVMEGQAAMTRLMEAENQIRALSYDQRILESLNQSLQNDGQGGDALRRAVVLGRTLVPTIENVYSALQQLRAERNRLTASRFGYTDEGAEVVVLDSLIADRRAELRAIVEESLGVLRDRLEAAEDRAEELRQEVTRVPSQSAELARYEQRVGAIERTYDMLTEKYHEAQIAEAVESGDVEVIDPPVVPIAPDPRDPFGTVALALFLGLLIGGISAVIVDHFDTTIRSPEDAEAAADLGVLVSIPIFGTANNKYVLGNGTRQAAAQSTASMEAFRALRTMLRFVSTEQPRVVSVTGPGPGVGKSTVAGNLAAILAEQGSHVLLVDADLRRPVLHAVYGLGRSPGLTDVLVGEEELSNVIRAPSFDGQTIQGLKILTSGSPAPNPSELLGTDKFKALISSLRRQFDFVVIDSPPVLSVTDPLVLAPLTDGVLFVAAAGETEVRAVTESVRRLRRTHAPLIGVVLNKLSRQTEGYQEYGYGYGKYDESDISV